MITYPFSDEEIRTELAFADDSAMIERLNERGYNVYDHDPVKRLLEDLYYLAIISNTELLKQLDLLWRQQLSKIPQNGTGGS